MDFNFQTLFYKNTFRFITYISYFNLCHYVYNKQVDTKYFMVFTGMDRKKYLPESGGSKKAAHIGRRPEKR